MSHHHSVELPEAGRRKLRIRLAALVVPVALFTFIALIVLWPRGENLLGTIPVDSSGIERVIGEITSIVPADGSHAASVRMSTGGVDVEVSVPAEIVANGLSVGDKIHAFFNPQAAGTSSAYIFADFVRTFPMLALVGVYALTVILVARMKGFMALVGLTACLVIVGAFLIPALLAGENPLLVMLVGSAAMMFASIYLAHGVSIRTTTAVLGTFGGLLITLGVAAVATDGLRLTGTVSEEALILLGAVPNLDMKALLLCGMLLAGLGALNDVTITQVSTVWELHAANPASPRRRLFAQGMAVGRDHIASTVYTLAFAYVGTALPMLMTAALMQRPTSRLLQLSMIAEEITRTLTASIGLILAIPITTAIAAALAPVAPTKHRGEWDLPEAHEHGEYKNGEVSIEREGSGEAKSRADEVGHENSQIQANSQIQVDATNVGSQTHDRREKGEQTP